MKRVKDDMLPGWLQIDKSALKGTLLSIPERIDIPFNANEQLIVELYSK
jgi:small subunit ribosomal protein S4